MTGVKLKVTIKDLQGNNEALPYFSYLHFITTSLKLRFTQKQTCISFAEDMF
jgi:hypothetical protein